jgi:predicted deacetylase
MVGAPRGWRRRAAARWFARGQGELAACDGAETRRRLDLADAIFARAGLVTCGFVPPAWLLSAEAEVAVAARSPRFCERFAGIACDGELLARRMIGWGSLTAVEARATAAWAGIQVRRRPADTRLALHPPDLARTVTRRSAVRTLAALAERLPPASYATFLDACGARRA